MNRTIASILLGAAALLALSPLALADEVRVEVHDRVEQRPRRIHHRRRHVEHIERVERHEERPRDHVEVQAVIR